MFGDKLRHILNSKNISAKELSFNSGISQSHLSKIINNQVLPRFDKIECIADALQVSPGIFFNNENNKNSFGKPLNLNAAIIETDFKLADIYLNDRKNVFGFYLKYLKDYEAMLNKYDDIIKSDYEFFAFVNEGEIIFIFPNGKVKEFPAGKILRKENNFDEIVYSAKAGTCSTAVFMGCNMNLLWDFYTQNEDSVIAQRVLT